MLYKWCKKIRVGQRLYIKSKKEVINEFGDFDNVPCDNVEYILEHYETFSAKVTKETKEKILKATSIKDKLFYEIPVALLKVSNADMNTLTEDEECKKTKEKFDKEIIEEMIGKVDKEKCLKLFQLAVDEQHGRVDENIFNEYINNWAKGKYEIYLSMGRCLTKTTQVDISINENEMYAMIKELGGIFPKYGIHFNQFRVEDFIENNVYYVPEYYREYASEYFKKGMKLSKCFSKFFQDEKFDIALSKVMQNKKFKGEIVLSIDPMDFLTMSITKHKWVSCYNIINGCFKTCAFSIMQDNKTMIGYRHNKKEYEYEYSGKKFTWNSKQSRNVIVLDFEKDRLCIGGAQGSPNDEYYDIVKEMSVDLLNNYLGSNKNHSEYKQSRGYNIWRGNYDHLRDDMYDRNYYYNGNSFGDLMKIGVEKIKNPITGEITKGTNHL